VNESLTVCFLDDGDMGTYNDWSEHSYE